MSVSQKFFFFERELNEMLIALIHCVARPLSVTQTSEGSGDKSWPQKASPGVAAIGMTPGKS